MAEILAFPTSYPAQQWKLRRDLERYLTLVGENPERFMHDMGLIEKMPPEQFSDEMLFKLVELFKHEYALKQCGISTLITTEEADRLEAEGVPQAAPPKAKRPARVYAFPMTPEIEARQQAARAAKPKRTRAATRAVSVQADDKDKATKAKYIQRVKMLQRDCEKNLPRFDDSTYRAILAEQFNADTSKALSVPQLRALLLHLQGLLNDSAGSRASFRASNDAPALLYHDATGLNRCGQMRKIQALLAEKGKAERKYVRWSYALGILKRQTGGVATDWESTSPRQLDAVINALARDAGRKGRRAR